MNFNHEVTLAQQRVHAYLKETPLEYSSQLSQATGYNVFLKLENLQPTGSFKIRGAFNKLLSLTPEVLKSGVVTASSGNHGAAVAYAAHQMNVDAMVFVPENASALKITAIRQLGARLQTYGTDSGLTETHARSYANQHGLAYISPYNDPHGRRD